MPSSESGIPQHWQTSCLGDPSNVLIETPNSFESSFSVSVFGCVSPVSQRLTACLVTIRRSASSSWVRCLLSRNPFSIVPVFMFIPPMSPELSALIIDHLFPREKQPAVA